jgi:aryl-alcohol dehydrogenase-like predicted oxidoreductase
MPADDDTRPLGRTGIHVLPLGIGTNKWRRADRAAVLETYRTVNDAGSCMIDTAEIYFSERVVGDCLRAGATRAVIATKFFPFPGRSSPRRLMHGLDGSLARLGLKTIDLYYVHFPLPLMDVRVFAEGLVEAVKSGKARAVGVANFGADQMRRIADHLARAGVPLAANQVNYSLLHRAAETNGVLDACRPLKKLGQHGVLLRVFSELRKRLLERHFSRAGIKPSLADYLSQSLSNDPDIERRIPRKRAPAIAGIPVLT